MSEARIPPDYLDPQANQRYLDFLSSLNPVGTAQAQPIPQAHAARTELYPERRPPVARRQQDLDRLFNAIYRIETASGRNVRRSAAGAIGPMQIMPQTFQRYARQGEDINNPTDNINVGRRIIADLYDRYGGNIDAVLIGYNSRESNIGLPWSQIERQIPETAHYLVRAHELMGTPFNPFQLQNIRRGVPTPQTPPQQQAVTYPPGPQRAPMQAQVQRAPTQVPVSEEEPPEPPRPSEQSFPQTAPPTTAPPPQQGPRLAAGGVLTPKPDTTPPPDDDATSYIPPPPSVPTGPATSTRPRGPVSGAEGFPSATEEPKEPDTSQVERDADKEAGRDRGGQAAPAPAPDRDQQTPQAPPQIAIGAPDQQQAGGPGAGAPETTAPTVQPPQGSPFQPAQPSVPSYGAVDQGNAGSQSEADAGGTMGPQGLEGGPGVAGGGGTADGTTAAPAAPATPEQPPQEQLPEHPVPGAEETPISLPQSAYDAIANSAGTKQPTTGAIDYGRVSNGGGSQDLENKTIADVYWTVPGGPNFGGMAINRDDLLSAAHAVGLDPYSAKFSRQNQERMTDYLFQTKGPDYFPGLSQNPNNLSIAMGTTFKDFPAGQRFLSEQEANAEQYRRELQRDMQDLDDRRANPYDPRYKELRDQALQKERGLADAMTLLAMNPPHRSVPDMQRDMQSIALAAAVIGGSGVRNPATTMLNAMAGIMNAQTKNDDKAFKDALDIWKTQLSAAHNAFAAQHQIYAETLTDEKADLAEKDLKLKYNAGILKDLDSQRLLNAGEYTKFIQVQNDRYNLMRTMKATGDATHEGMLFDQTIKERNRKWVDAHQDYMAQHPELRGMPPATTQWQIWNATKEEQKLASAKGKTTGEPTIGTAAWMLKHWIDSEVQRTGRYPAEPDIEKKFQQFQERGGVLPDTSKDAQLPTEYEGRPNRPPPGAEDIPDDAWQAALQNVISGGVIKPEALRSRGRPWVLAYSRAVPIARRVMHQTPESEIQLGRDYRNINTAQQSMARAGASGDLAKNVQAMNTLAHHIKQFRQYADLVNHGRFTRANQLFDTWSAETGSGAILQAWVNHNVTADEMVRVLTPTSGGTITDRTEMQKNLDTARSRGQLNDIADALQQIVYGRLEAMRQRWISVAGDDPDRQKRLQQFDQNFVSDLSRDMFAHRPRVGGPIKGDIVSVYPIDSDEIQHWRFEGGNRADTKNWTRVD